MHYFHCQSSALRVGATPRPLPVLHPWPRWVTFVPGLLICPPLEKNPMLLPPPSWLRLTGGLLLAEISRNENFGQHVCQLCLSAGRVLCLFVCLHYYQLP